MVTRIVGESNAGWVSPLARSRPARNWNARDRQAATWVRKTSLWTEAMTKALNHQGKEGKRWYSLVDKVSSELALAKGWMRVRANRGAPGVDGVTLERFEGTLDVRLGRLQTELREGRYQPQGIRRVMIEKGDGKQRPLGIPVIADRVVQAAVLEVIEPIFEHRFEPSSYGFRPNRGCKDALRAVQAGLDAGLHHIVDADLQAYFDSIPHQPLMDSLGEVISDGSLLSLIESFLHQEIISELSSWKPSSGTPQGAVLSPLLANWYLHPLDQLMCERAQTLGNCRMIRYADDFVVMCATAEAAEEALELVRQWVVEAGLQLHPDKTRAADLTQAGTYIDFLGYRFERAGAHIRRGIRPKSFASIRIRIKELTPRKSGRSTAEIVDRLNRLLRGVFNYFQHVSFLTNGGKRSKRTDLYLLDCRARARLRRILSVREKRYKRGRGRQACTRWDTAYFNRLGLFSMHSAQVAALRSHRGPT